MTFYRGIFVENPEERSIGFISVSDCLLTALGSQDAFVPPPQPILFKGHRSRGGQGKPSGYASKVYIFDERKILFWSGKLKQAKSVVKKLEKLFSRRPDAAIGDVTALLKYCKELKEVDVAFLMYEENRLRWSTNAPKEKLSDGTRSFFSGSGKGFKVSPESWVKKGNYFGRRAEPENFPTPVRDIFEYISMALLHEGTQLGFQYFDFGGYYEVFYSDISGFCYAKMSFAIADFLPSGKIDFRVVSAKREGNEVSIYRFDPADEYFVFNKLGAVETTVLKPFEVNQTSVMRDLPDVALAAQEDAEVFFVVIMEDGKMIGVEKFDSNPFDLKRSNEQVLSAIRAGSQLALIELDPMRRETLDKILQSLKSRQGTKE